MSEQLGEFSRAIRREQALTALRNLPVTLRASLAILTSASYVLWTNTEAFWIPYWYAISLGIALYRQWIADRFERTGVTHENAVTILRTIERGSIVTGSLWGVLPLLLIQQDNSMINGFVIFIIAGVSSGALIQSTSYSQIPVNFVVPALSGSALALFAQFTPTTIVIGANVVLLAYMMVRAGRRTEREYWDAQWLRLEATSLAKSLRHANMEALAANTRLSEMAQHDVMTGLLNRAAFNDNLALLMKNARDTRTDLALLVIDLDNFKVINDTQGHGAGDRVIAEAANRLTSLCGREVFVARLGGDEFGMIVRGPLARREAVRLAGEVINSMTLPISLGDRAANVGASVGLAVYPDDATTAEDLFSSADIALYDAKEKGRRRTAQFDSRLKERLEVRRKLESDLAAAIANRLLDVYFQPQFDVRTRRVVGYEALIRWNHPTLGQISPPDIITASQMTHQSDRLTAYVLEASADLIDRLALLGYDGFTVAVNISPVEFLTHSPADLILSCIERRGIAPWRIEVEITEEAILDAQAANSDLMRLERAGVRIAIDDFGAGHSSLAHIVDLKIDRIKIDRAFIQNLDTNVRHQALVEATVNLGKTLGIQVLAEGIETEAVADRLTRLNCDFGQGYLIARPMPMGALTKWLETQCDKPAAVIEDVSGARQRA